MSNDWIEHNGGPQPVADDVWVETSRLYHGTHRNLARWIEWDCKILYRIFNQHLIDAARLEGIRLGLEAADRAIKALFSPGDTPLEAMALIDASKAVRNLNPETIAREAVLDQLTSEAQADNMGYDKETAR